MRLLRLFGATFSISLRRQLAFRADLAFQALTTVIGVASGLAALGIVYTQTRSLGGWGLGEAVVLLGTYQIVSGVLATFIEPNVVWFAGQVTSGKLDDVLLKPVPSIFLASLGSCAPLGLTQVAMGLAVVGAGLREMDAIPRAYNLFGWLVMLSAGIAITWASRVLLASLAFWAPAMELDVVYGAVWQFGRYPVSVYPQPVRFALTWVLPVAFVSTLPAQALVRGVGPALLLLGTAIGAASLLVVQLVWSAGLRRYTSATS